MSDTGGMTMDREEVRRRIEELRETEARSCSMDPALITPEYVYRMWGGKVPLEVIEEVLR